MIFTLKFYICPFRQVSERTLTVLFKLKETKQAGLGFAGLIRLPDP